MTSSSDVTADHRIVMFDRSWADYEAQLALQGQRRRPKLAYLDGAIEQMSPSRDHERINTRIGRILDAYLVASGVLGSANGEWTLRDQASEAGAQPDECYLFGPDPDAKDRPDLVIEVNWSRGGIDKLAIYQRLRIAEVWFWENAEIVVHVLGARGYEIRERSTFVPGLDLGFVCSLLELATVNEVHVAMRAWIEATPAARGTR
ncbi:MAG: Uma2 family endonuclease [Kofleriaceae bacterium]